MSDGVFLTRRSPPLPSGRAPRSSLMSEPGEHPRRSPAQHQNTKATPRHTLLDACLTPPDISQTKQGRRGLGGCARRTAGSTQVGRGASQPVTFTAGRLAMGSSSHGCATHLARRSPTLRVPRGYRHIWPGQGVPPCWPCWLRSLKCL